MDEGGADGGSPLPGALRPLGGAIEPVYRRVVARRNARFDSGRGVVTLDRPVISVGNLTVGGTGKTPMVDRIVRWLIEAGHRPAIAMRGYGARRGEPGDEARLYRDAFEGVPIVAQPDRLDGLLGMFASAEGRAVDVVVLDDGFQHRRLGRALDLVLIDATRDPRADRCLPAGWLREPVEALSRAGGVVLTHTDRASPSGLRAVEGVARAFSGAGPVAWTRHAWTGVRVLVDGREQARPESWLAGRRGLAVCALGRPASFFRACEAAGARLIDAVALRDHDPYSTRTIEWLLRTLERSGAETLLVTEKDWTKLRRVRPELWPCPVARPELSLGFVRGEGDLRSLVLRAAASDPDDPAIRWEPEGPGQDVAGSGSISSRSAFG